MNVLNESPSWWRLPRLLLGSFGIVRRAAPRDFAINTALQVVQAVATATQLLVVRNVLAGVMSESTHRNYLPLIEQLLLLIGLQTLTGLVTTYTNMQQRLVMELVQRHASKPVTDVATTIGLRDFDTPEFHDRMQRAQQTAMVRPVQITVAVLTLSRSLFGLLGVVAVLFVLSPLLLAFSLLAFLPLWLATTRISRAVYEFMLEMTPNDRKRGYVLSLLTSRDGAKEVRAFGQGGYLREVYERLSDERISRLREHLHRRAGLSFMGSASNAVATGITIGVLIWLITSGHLSLAIAGAAAVASFQLGNQLQGITLAGGQLYECALFIEDLDAFLQLLPTLAAARPTAPAPRGFEKLEVRDVHFTYPTTLAPATPPRPADRARRPNRPRAAPRMMGFGPMLFFGSRSSEAHSEGTRRTHALRGVSMELKRGEVVALVGENGSGKTTLAKLVSGLYNPDQGQVLWDGVDVSQVDQDQLRSHITMIFQDFARYWLTARENIGMGRVEWMCDQEAIEAAARHAGADRFIEAWPEAYDTLMGPIFEGGKDLSVGQWQRMALARAFFRASPVVILDEPTASLDARAEAQLFEKMRTLFHGRSVLLISHRFSSMRSADRIYVMKEGEIIEHGTHEELMKVGGLYFELFSLQAAAYSETRPTPEK